MGIRTTVAASLGNDSARVSLLHPLLDREDETIQACRIFYSLEFGEIKIRIIIDSQISRNSMELS